MLQWQLSWWASLGVHVDLKRRHAANGQFKGRSYGPYLDVHAGFVIVSVGWRPYLTGELMNESGAARGGISVPSDDELIVDRVAWKWRTFVEGVLILLLVSNVVGTYMRIKHWGLP